MNPSWKRTAVPLYWTLFIDLFFDLRTRPIFFYSRRLWLPLVQHRFIGWKGGAGWIQFTSWWAHCHPLGNLISHRQPHWASWSQSFMDRTVSSCYWYFSMGLNATGWNLDTRWSDDRKRPDWSKFIGRVVLGQGLIGYTPGTLMACQIRIGSTDRNWRFWRC